MNTAEAPVAQARTQAAQAQVTAVNIGEAQTKNQLQGQAALQGFVGGSSSLDNALSQSGISAAQAGAADVGAANVANAEDYQAIANMGANTQASLADQLAQEQQAITGQGATGQFNLETALATGTQGLQDTGATGKAAIANTVAGQTEQNLNTGAATQYANTAAGIAAQNALNQQGAEGQYQLQSQEAQQEEQNVQNQYGQSLQGALALSAAPGQEAGAIANTDSLQNAGLINAQNALNWWATPATPPNPTTTTTQASTLGNTIASAGTGLLGAAASIGNSNNWWQTPASSTVPNTGTGAFTSNPGTFNIGTSLVPPATTTAPNP